MKSKLTSILLSLAIAFGLWMYVITSVSPGSEETYYNIPVVMDGEALLAERNLMITESSGSSATLVLSGNRSDLYKVNRENITLKANLGTPAPATADAGVAVYVALALVALCGTAVVTSKKRQII